MTYNNERFIRKLRADGWIVTSVFRADDIHHRQGKAIDALPSSFSNGVPETSPPLYKNAKVVRDVERLVWDTNYNALIEEGHVHFYRGVPNDYINRRFGHASTLIMNTH